MKASEIRSMSVAQLETKLVEMKRDLFMLRMQLATNHLDNPTKTVIREKEVGGDAK